MEAKLEKYRIRKKRKQLFENFKQKILNLMPFQQTKKEHLKIDIPPNDDENIDQQETINENATSEEFELIASASDENEDANNEENLPENLWFKYSLWVLYFLFWVTCYAIAIELKFGVVYLILSALFGIYFNTRTGPKKQGEISAYSVFNENCTSIDGTLKAEQFEREIRYGYASVR